MKIKYISIKVSDISKSRYLYEKILDFKVIDEYESDTINVVMLNDGYINLELIEANSDDETTGLNNLGIEVDDIKEAVNKLENMGMEFISKAYLNSDYNVATFKDFDNVELTLIEKEKGD